MSSQRWAKPGALALVATSAALVLSWADLPVQEGTPQIPHKDFSNAEAHAVIRVVSGDTVVLSTGKTSRRIGLIGAQAPPRSGPRGRQAQRFLDNLLRGETVHVEYPSGEAEIDKFGRHPAYLYRAPEGLFVNLELVRQGFVTVPDGSTFEHRKLFEYFEQRARKYKKGQWREDAPAQAEAAAAPAEAAGAEKAATGSSKEKAEPAADDTTVYVTPHGEKYHRADCYHLRKNRIPISLKEAKARGYTPCSHCKPPK